jgi:trehalose-6-phosphate synthase
MWNEDELPDDDVRAVYGEKAAHARLIARLDRLEKNLDERLRAAEVLLQRQPRHQKE